MESIKTGIALWQLSQLLSESENELWLSNNIHLFFLPMKFGMTFIFSTILAETAVFGIDLNTLQGGTYVNIQTDYHNIPIYKLLQIPIDNIMLSDSSIYNVTCKKYMNEYNIRNILSFFRYIVKNRPKNALEGRLQDMLLKKTYDSLSFLQYIDQHTIYKN